MNIFQDEITAREYLVQRIGSISQIAGIREIELKKGRAHGVKALEVRSGTGFQFTVLLDRGMDIADAEYCGKPLAWMSKNGIVNPQFFENGGIGFLRSFSGGLLTTCGLTQAGDSGIDGDEVLGIHGRISHLPAENYAYEEFWDGNDYRMKITGHMRESCLYSENLVLKREITCKMGESKLEIKDTVKNEGYAASPFMLFYHINFGYPVVSEFTRMISSAVEVTPLNDDALKGDGRWSSINAPESDYKWQSFIHHMPVDRELVYAGLVNEKHKFGSYIAYSAKQMPYFTEWKMLAQQDYVVGFEPGICIPEGRLSARKNGRLRTISPGEEHQIAYEIGVLDGLQEIKDIIKKV